MREIEKKENKRVSFTTTISPTTREELLMFVTLSRGKVRGANDVVEYLIKKYLPITTADEISSFMEMQKKGGKTEEKNVDSSIPLNVLVEKSTGVEDNLQKPTKEELRSAFKNL